MARQAISSSRCRIADFTISFESGRQTLQGRFSVDTHMRERFFLQRRKPAGYRDNQRYYISSAFGFQRSMRRRLNAYIYGHNISTNFGCVYADFSFSGDAAHSLLFSLLQQH